MTKFRESPSPHYIPGSSGDLFVLVHGTPAMGSHWVLLVPPFAEELNKTRRTYTLLAQALSAKGFVVALFDLYGTGDSAGEFEDATWEVWKSDIETTIDWIDDQGGVLDGAVAVRSAALLAAEYFADAGVKLSQFALWQPVIVGDQFLTQFLRNRIVANSFHGKSSETVADLKRDLDSGETLAVAGYSLTSGVSKGISAAMLETSLVAGIYGSVRIFEVTSKTLSPLLSGFVERIANTMQNVSTVTVPGALFWTTTEMTSNQVLVQLTSDWFDAPE